MKRFLAIALMAALALPVLAACDTFASTVGAKVSSTAYQQVSAEEAIRLMDSESDYIILDVRNPDEFEQGHIPNAVNLPLGSIGYGEMGPLDSKDQLILVYCRSGNRSKQASAQLAALGYTNVVEFGGIKDWPGEVVRGQD